MHKNDDSEYGHIEEQGEDGIIASVFTGLGLNKTVYVRIIIHPIGEGQGPPLVRKKVSKNFISVSMDLALVG